ncbi:MAG: hypothetical protein AAF617_09765, partial [Bacteroidota bacterium]
QFKDFVINAFEKYLSFIMVGMHVEGFQWGDFCIDTWDVNEDRYDYSMNNKSDATKKYLQMLTDNSIEFKYSGLCKCNNWKRFVDIMMDCLYDNVAPYSFLFYVPMADFYFYLHNSNSLGIFYENKNEELLQFITYIKSLNWEVTFTNDEFFNE